MAGQRVTCDRCPTELEGLDETASPALLDLCVPCFIEWNRHRALVPEPEPVTLLVRRCMGTREVGCARTLSVRVLAYQGDSWLDTHGLCDRCLGDTFSGIDDLVDGVLEHSDPVTVEAPKNEKPFGTIPWEIPSSAITQCIREREVVREDDAVRGIGFGLLVSGPVWIGLIALGLGALRFSR